MTGLPRGTTRYHALNILPVFKETGCRGGTRQPLEHLPPDLKGYGDGVQRLGFNAPIRKWFQKIGRRDDFIWCMYFLNAQWLEPY